LLEVPREEDSPEENIIFFQKLKKLSDHYNLPVYQLTNIHCSLEKLFRAALRTPSVKQEVTLFISFIRFSCVTEFNCLFQILKEDLVEFLK